MSDPVYIIGIDLGTTNSVVAYTKIENEKGVRPEISILQIPQLVEAGVVETRDMLPSFVLLPGPHDVPQQALELPWEETDTPAVGEFARERGAELPHRLISSSKSWLCHSLVDRNKPILPWNGPEDARKLSPVDASAAILRHIRNTWNYAIAKDDDRLKMEYQEVFLTVPASFDAVARELTVNAASAAGLDTVTLLEEPQAAFYAWIESSGDAWRDQVRVGDSVLVCDIGGGTSDFSLIKVSEQSGELTLERIAVGDHLLVGGDNMDLALAYAVVNQMAEQGKKLDQWQIRGLWHSCRKAKERIFTDMQIDEYPVTILGKGSRLIGGTIKTRLERNRVEDVVLDGFFPKCDRGSFPDASQRVGIRELGLAYEADPAVTRHLAQFVGRHGADDDAAALPTAILFNGGVMKAVPVRKRILEVFNDWKKTANDESGAADIREIHSTDFDLGVARGAAYYGLARRGQGIRIRGGLGRSYYIGVAASLPAVPGMPIPIKALCVAPFGMEYGTDAVLSDQEFVLVVGEPVKFDFMGSSIRLNDAVGSIVDEWEDDIEPITTIETVLDGEPGAVIPVMLEIRVTEIGTLELWCVSRQDDNRWKLEFNVREREQ